MDVEVKCVIINYIFPWKFEEKNDEGDGDTKTQQASHFISNKRKPCILQQLKFHSLLCCAMLLMPYYWMFLYGKKCRSTGGSKTNITAKEGMDFQVYV